MERVRSLVRCGFHEAVADNLQIPREKLKTRAGCSQERLLEALACSNATHNQTRLEQPAMFERSNDTKGNIMSITRCILRWGLVSGLALGGVTLLVGPERVSAGLSMIRCK